MVTCVNSSSLRDTDILFSQDMVSNHWNFKNLCPSDFFSQLIQKAATLQLNVFKHKFFLIKLFNEMTASLTNVLLLVCPSGTLLSARDQLLFP